MDKPAPRSMVFCINFLLEVMGLIVNGLNGKLSTDDSRPLTVNCGQKIKAVLPKCFGSERDCHDPEV
jgi:hypothetical protein